MKAKDLTLGGICVALTLILLYFTLIFKTNTLTLLTLASFVVPLALMRGNLRTALLIYISSTLLAFLLLPINVSLLYGLFFGIYGIIKYFIERFHNLGVEIVLKLLFFNLIGALFILFFKAFVDPLLLEKPLLLIARYLPQLSITLKWTILFISFQGIFLVFDYALTLLIDYYQQHFSRIR